MSLAGHEPPPFFRRGPAPLVKLFVLVSLSLTMLVVDHRFRTLSFVRQVVGVAIAPLQLAIAEPLVWLDRSYANFGALTDAQQQNVALRAQLKEVQSRQLRLQSLETENDRLRTLMQLKTRLATQGKVAEILYAARDVFDRRVVIDKGAAQGIDEGQPVVDERGLIGQVTRVLPLFSEVRLITDKDQAVPVQVERSGLHAVLFGAGASELEIRFLAANTDVQPGDVVSTSGLDGVFLPGLPVARVKRVERESADGFARIVCDPIAGVENHGQVLVLDKRAPAPTLSSDSATSSSDKKSDDKKSAGGR